MAEHLHGEFVSFGTCVLYAFDGNLKALEEQVAPIEKRSAPTTLTDLDITPESVDLTWTSLLSELRRPTSEIKLLIWILTDRYARQFLIPCIQ